MTTEPVTSAEASAQAIAAAVQLMMSRPTQPTLVGVPPPSLDEQASEVGRLAAVLLEKFREHRDVRYLTRCQNDARERYRQPAEAPRRFVVR